MKSRLPASPFFGRICQHGWAFICQGTQDSRLFHTHSQAYTHMRVYRCFFLRGILVSAFPGSPSSSVSVAVGNLFCMLIADKHLMRFIIKLEIVRHTHGMATSTRSRGAEKQRSGTRCPELSLSRLWRPFRNQRQSRFAKYFPQKEKKHITNLKPVRNGNFISKCNALHFNYSQKLLQYSHNKVQICCKSFIFDLPHAHKICFCPCCSHGRK